MVDSTPDSRKRMSEGLAEAYREMEDAICDLRNAEQLCELALQHVHDQGIGLDPEETKSKIREIKKRVFAVDDDDLSSLTYAVHHVGALIEDLFETYFAEFNRSREKAQESPHV